MKNFNYKSMLVLLLVCLSLGAMSFQAQNTEQKDSVEILADDVGQISSVISQAISLEINPCDVNILNSEKLLMLVAIDATAVGIPTSKNVNSVVNLRYKLQHNDKSNEFINTLQSDIHLAGVGKLHSEIPIHKVGTNYHL